MMIGRNYLVINKDIHSVFYERNPFQMIGVNQAGTNFKEDLFVDSFFTTQRYHKYLYEDASK